MLRSFFSHHSNPKVEIVVFQRHNHKLFDLQEGAIQSNAQWPHAIVIGSVWPFHEWKMLCMYFRKLIESLERHNNLLKCQLCTWLNLFYYLRVYNSISTSQRIIDLCKVGDIVNKRLLWHFTLCFRHHVENRKINQLCRITEKYREKTANNFKWPKTISYANPILTFSGDI